MVGPLFFKLAKVRAYSGRTTKKITFYYKGYLVYKFIYIFFSVEKKKLHYENPDKFSLKAPYVIMLIAAIPAFIYIAKNRQQNHILDKMKS